VCSASLVIAAFVLGASLGTITADRAGEGRILAVLSAEFLVLLIAFGLALSGYPRAALFVVAAAMGMQNAVHQLIAGADVGRSFITGALFGLGQSLAQILVGKGCMRRAMLLASSWLAFASGAVAGSVAFAAVELLPSLAFVIALLSLAILLLMLGLF
jgi:oxalate decarboxylase